MNKFGIKVYADGVQDINNIGFEVNSIKHHCSYILTFKSRIVNYRTFGIYLHIKNKNLNE